MKKVIATKNAPAAIGPYSQAVQVGNMLFASGQLGLDPATGNFAEGGVKEQTVQAFKNVHAILEEAGLSINDVVKTTVFLADMSDFAAMNEVYASQFEGTFPARSAVAVKTLPKNGLVEIDEAIAPGNQWTTFVGEGKRVSLMPVSDGRFYFFFDVPLPAGLAEDRSTLRADLNRYFSGWAPQVQKLIAALDPQTTNRIEIHDIEPFERLVRGKVALLGDAGHSTTPDIGQGGCAAMEDAVVLGECLRENHSITLALRQYEALRCDRVRDLVLKARKRCDVTHGKDMALTQAWYQELKEETGERIINGLCETIQGGPLG